MVLLTGKMCFLVLAVVLVVCASVSVAKDDPERRTCNPPENEYGMCREKSQETEPGGREQLLNKRECEQKRHCGRDEFDGERMRGQEEKEESGKNPYVFHDEHFDTALETSLGTVRVLPKFTKMSKLFQGIENFRVVFSELSPQSFVVPNHWDADAIFFAVQGRGTFTLVFKDRRESFNIERGHVMVRPAGVTAYMIVGDNNEKLVLVELINPVLNLGEFVPFFGPGGQNPESLFSAFDDQVLEAVFKTSIDRIQRIFSQKRDGAIVRASKEQIRGLTHEEGGQWPFGGKGSKDLSPVDLLRQHPSQSNEFGNLFELNHRDHKVLKDLGIAVSFVNITKGSMHTAFYNSRATKIAVVVNGRGQFQMACPDVSSSDHKPHHRHHYHEGDRSKQDEESTSPVHYQKISSELRRGTVFVVPAGHPFVTMASQDENLEVVCFEVNAENNYRFPLVGQKSVMKNIEREAKELAFATSPEEVDEIFANQEEEFFFRGPSWQQLRHLHDNIATI